MKEPGRVDWFESFNGFHLYYDIFFNEQAETVSAVEGPAAIKRAQWLLSFESQPPFNEFKRQTRFVARSSSPCPGSRCTAIAAPMIRAVNVSSRSFMRRSGMHSRGSTKNGAESRR